MTRVAFVLGLALLATAANADERNAREDDGRAAGRRDFDKKNPLDRDFLAVASECANCATGMAALVEKRASRQEVKDFAKKMDEDHRKMLNDLARVVKDRKIAIVAGTSQKDRERIGEVGKLEGAEFEKAFLKEVVARHEKAIAMCDNQAKNGKDKEISAFARDAAKVLREHLATAKRLSS